MTIKIKESGVWHIATLSKLVQATFKGTPRIGWIFSTYGGEFAIWTGYGDITPSSRIGQFIEAATGEVLKRGAEFEQMEFIGREVLVLVGPRMIKKEWKDSIIQIREYKK